MVVTPVRDAGVKHVEFVPLDPTRALAIVVFEDGSIENRLMLTPPGLTPSILQEASNFLSARLQGRTLAEAGVEIGAELETARRELNETAARLVQDGLAAWGGAPGERALIVRGRANLLADPGARDDLDRVRLLFDDLEQKEQLIGLLDDVRTGRGRAHLHRGGDAAVLAFGFRRDRGALYERQAEGGGRDRGDRAGAPELCAGDPACGLYRAGARPPAGRLNPDRPAPPI